MTRRLASARSLVLAAIASALLAALPAGAADLTMKNLMKKMGVRSSAGDTRAMVPLLARTKELAPSDPEFAGWGAIAERGRAAADKDDLAAAKATCKECHRQYRDRYKTKYGSKAP